jgi:GAF domain-containing protein
MSRARTSWCSRRSRGEGEGTIVGLRLPADTGIAGWVLACGEAVLVEDVNQDPRFARAVAERTGYIPRALLSAPLQYEGEALGVLNVLDRERRRFLEGGEMRLLALFADHAAIALTVVQASRSATESTNS